jgi:hypothetical protein
LFAQTESVLLGAAYHGPSGVQVDVAYRLERLPFPLAHAARAVETARDPEHRLSAAQHFVEMTAHTLGVLCLGWCRSRGVGSDAVRDWESAVDSKGVALGRWTTLVRAVSRVMAEHPGDPLARSIKLAVDATLPRLTASCRPGTRSRTAASLGW